MANSSYYQKLFSISFLFFFFFLTFFLLLLNKVNSIETVSFEFTEFNRDQENLIFQGDANTSSGVLHVSGECEGIPLYQSVGRVLYKAPINIWDSKTGTIASFQTNFSIVINAVDKTKTADGFAFFLAPVNTHIPQSEQGLLGIFSDIPSLGSSEPIVAVEFDTFSNQAWDPEGHHIGIDVKSIKSMKTTPWIWLNNTIANVSISYDAISTFLSVSLVYSSNSTSILKRRVDLTDVLPPWVRVGFSATTGNFDLVETHHVHSWSFISTLQDSSSIYTQGFNDINIL